MAAFAFLKMNSASGTSVTSVTVSSVSMTAGTRLVVGVGIVDPFDANTASSVSIQGAAASLDVGLKGTGTPRSWYYNALWSMAINTTSTASVVVTLDGALGLAASQCIVVVGQVTGGNTSSPVGAVTTSELGSTTSPISAVTAVNDIMVSLVSAGDGVNDRWLQTGSGTISLYNNSPRPGSSTATQISFAYNTASGATTTLTWDYFGFDAGPIPVSTEMIHVGAVYQTAGAGGGTVPFFAYTRNSLTAGAI